MKFQSHPLQLHFNFAATLRFILCCLLLIAGVKSYAQDANAAKPAIANRLPVYPLDVVVNDDDQAFVVDRNLPGVWTWKDDKLSKLFEGSPKFRTPLNAARSIAFDEKGGLLIGDTSTRDIYRVSPSGKAEPITGGKIGIPMDIAVAKDGTIYVADLELRKVLKIPAGSQEVEEVADVNPRGLTLDSQGQLWVISQDEKQVVRIDSAGKVEAVVEKRTFEFPHQIAVNADGVAFVTDGYKKAIWKIEPGQAPEILFEGSPLDNPVGIFIKNEKLFVVDPRAKTVFRLGEDNKPVAWFSISRD